MRDRRGLVEAEGIGRESGSGEGQRVMVFKFKMHRFILRTDVVGFRIWNSESEVLEFPDFDSKILLKFTSDSELLKFHFQCGQNRNKSQNFQKIRILRTPKIVYGCKGCWTAYHFPSIIIFLVKYSIAHCL